VLPTVTAFRGISEGGSRGLPLAGAAVGSYQIVTTFSSGSIYYRVLVAARYPDRREIQRSRRYTNALTQLMFLMHSPSLS